MKLVVLLGAAILSLNVVSSTFISTALGAGFLGGFLMGKITLGMFLAAMSTLNQRQPTTTTVPASVTINQQITRPATRDIPAAVEAAVRDRFLRQIGRMDPLNCLPKVFCEVSADPDAATAIFGPDAINLLTGNSPFNAKDENAQDDKGDDDSDDSQSDEEEDDMEDKVKEKEEKEEEDLENEGLDKLIHEFDDPINYYFALKEKNKPIHPELMQIIKNTDFSSRKGLTASKKKAGSDDKKALKKTSEKLSARKTFYSTSSLPRAAASVGRTVTESSIDDVFAADPFFEEFSRGLQQPQRRSANGGVVNVGVLRRNRRDVFASSEDDEEIMAKYKLAAETAESKDALKCQKVFSTCPFPAKEVMDMITKFNMEDDTKLGYGIKDKKIKKVDSLTSLKNTLAAIEKLNDATLNAEALGEPLDYNQLIKDASKSSSSVSDGSAKLVAEFKQIEQRFVPSKKAEEKPEIPQKKIAIKKQKQSVRRRRHNEGSRIHLIPVRFSTRDKNSKPTISVVNHPDSERSDVWMLPADRDDEFYNFEQRSFEPESRFVYAARNEEDSSEEIKAPKSNKPRRKPDTKFRNGPLIDDALEDDEFNSPESEEVVKVPSLTFSQSFLDTLDTPSQQRKPKPKPIHKLVKVKPQTLRKTSPRPASIETSTVKRSPFVPKLKQKFSGESEDDEEDAINKEKEIEALVSKYKPRDKLRHG